MLAVAALDVRAAIDPPPDAAAEIAADAAGADVTRATKVMESVATVVPAGNANVTGILDITPALKAGTVPKVMLVGATAFAGTTADIVPKPNTATTTSAMRLKVVFVDIYFLSLVDSRAFPESAW